MLLKQISTTLSVNSIEVQEYRQSVTAVQGLSDETVAKLSSYLDFIPSGTGGHLIRAKSHVGIVRLRDDLILNVLPKVKMENLLAMLNYVYGVPFVWEEEAPLQECRWLIKFLIRIFIDRVQRLYYHSFRRSYLMIEENRSSIKGKILVKENLNANRFHPEKTFCQFEDFTADILVNRIIKYTIFLLFNLDDGQFRNELRYIYALFHEVSLTNISVEDVDSVKYTRLDEAYKPVHMLCRLFIRHVFVSHKIGDQKMFCFLIDMNSLFEEFVRKILQMFSLNYRVRGHPKEKYLDQTNLVRIIPDIRLVEKSTDKMMSVADCKYKRLKKIEDDNEKAQIINSDVYQILAYMTGYRLNKGILIYPKDEIEQETEINVVFDGIAGKVFIRQIDLNQIQEPYLKAFAGKMESIVLT